jgi:hypothetical protein
MSTRVFIQSRKNPIDRNTAMQVNMPYWDKAADKTPERRKHSLERA